MEEKNNLKGPPAVYFNRHKDIGKCYVAVYMQTAVDAAIE